MTSYVRAHSVEEALEHLSRAPWRIVAGGTDVYPALVDRPLREPVLDLSGVSALRGITRHDDGFRIGALTTWTDVIRAELPAWFDGLKLAAREVGGVQIQNAGTVAGNICNASPAADGTAALLALDAEVEVQGPMVTRRMGLADFVLGPRQTALQAGELVTAIHVPAPPGRGVSDFLKLGARHYLVISIAMVSTVIHVDDEARVSRAGVAVGACSPVARRLPALEERLIGRRAGDGLAAALQASDLDVLSPISDVRASADYRRDAALTLVRRALERCEDALR
jgi:CO/xanthine dehydrogenase FAD-binding subunit